MLHRGRKQGFSPSERAFNWLTILPSPSSAPRILTPLQIQQIEKDVKRLYPESMSKELSPKLQLIQQIIEKAISTDEDTKYYQGFHDIVSVLATHFHPPQAEQIACRLASTLLQDFLKNPFEANLIPLMRLTAKVLARQQPSLAYLYQKQQYIYFRNQWFLVLFSRVYTGEQLLRLWDYLICSGPLAIVTLAAAFFLIHHDIFVPLSGELDISQLLMAFKKVEQKPPPVKVLIAESERLIEKGVLEAGDEFKKNSYFSEEWFEKMMGRKVCKHDPQLKVSTLGLVVVGTLFVAYAIKKLIK